MSSYEFKIEKEKAIHRYFRFSKIVKIFRTIEFFFATVVVWWLVSRSSPNSILRFLGASFRRCSTLLFNHHFVFLLGNAIIATLFVKFGRFDCKKQSISAEDEEYLIAESADTTSQIPTLESVSDEIRTVPAQIEAAPAEIEVAPAEIECPVSKIEAEVKRCRRTRSQEFDRETAQKSQLHRSETEPRRKLEEEEEAFEVDSLSNEEFQRKVEAFIARQQKFLRDESVSIVFA